MCADSGLHLYWRVCCVLLFQGVLDHSLISVWVPYTCADQLLGALRQHQDDHIHRQVSFGYRAVHRPEVAEKTCWPGCLLIKQSSTVITKLVMRATTIDIKVSQVWRYLERQRIFFFSSDCGQGFPKEAIAVAFLIFGGKIFGRSFVFCDIFNERLKFHWDRLKQFKSYRHLMCLGTTHEALWRLNHWWSSGSF